jgi:hypothetical protein
MNSNRSENWTTIINSVQTPLGLITLLALILDGSLIGISAFKGEVSLWAPISLLALLIIGVFAVVLINPKAFYHPRDWPPQEIPMPVNDMSLKVKVHFPAELRPLEFKFVQNSCLLEIHEREGTIKHHRTLDLIWGQDIWYFFIPMNTLSPNDYIYFDLVEYNGRKWTMTFEPNEIEVKARQET